MSDYAFVHEGKAYTPNGTDVPASQVADHNAQIERAQLELWQSAPTMFVAYYNFPSVTVAQREARTWGGTRWFLALENAHISTWLGTRIGTITSARVYRHNFGGRFVALRVQGTNGAEYHGRASWDWGSVITLRRAK